MLPSPSFLVPCSWFLISAMPTTKLDRINDKKLRASLTAAHASLRSGDYIDVVRRAADAYL